MKIAMIGHKRIPGREGGIEVVVEELSARMAALGNTVVAYNRSKKGLKQPKEYRGVQIKVTPTIEKKSTDAVIYSFLASIRALFGRYDVIHYHGIGPSIFLLLPHLAGIRTVVTVHGLNYKTPKWKGIGAKIMKAGERITAKYADEIIVLSEDQREYFKHTYGRDTVFIPNGTTLKEPVEAKEIKERFGLEKDGFVLFVSRVVPGKGLEYLLDAYRQIETDLPLVIAGGSVFVDAFYQMIQEKASRDSRVKLIGFVEGNILWELYSNAKLFVFPSEAEGMPMCLLEALSYDCNCLVSDIPENLEVGKAYVTSFRSCDTEDLREKLAVCLNKEGRNNSRAYIREHYSWDQVVEKTLDFYREN